MPNTRKSVTNTGLPKTQTSKKRNMTPNNAHHQVYNTNTKYTNTIKFYDDINHLANNI